MHVTNDMLSERLRKGCSDFASSFGSTKRLHGFYRRRDGIKIDSHGEHVPYLFEKYYYHISRLHILHNENVFVPIDWLIG